ncbi:hypothetical protein EPJ67_01845 [Brachyspira aalborgi]|uniref:Uncharacterized protein n=2 Tax=Brachyspira aalborgi TaxID=29522 RepID=A0A5C8G9B7_9SPIR|nr:hypothetical protein EPJ67_01845 [Brachyspira aalborgi]
MIIDKNKKNKNYGGANMLTEMKIKTIIKELEKNNKEISKIRESIDDFIENKNRLIERLEKENEKIMKELAK